MKEKLSSFYQLKADLREVSLEPGSTRLILEFDKRVDPELSAKRLRDLLGFVICSFKKPKPGQQMRLI